MVRPRSIVLNTMAAILTVLATSPQAPRQLHGVAADPLPPGLQLPPPAPPPVRLAIPVRILRPPPAAVRPAQRAIGAMVAVPAAPKPTTAAPTPILTITLPSPPSVPRRMTRPADRLWAGEVALPSEPPAGTPRTGWVDATR